METLVYLGIFSLIIVMVISFMLSTQETTLRTKRNESIHNASEFVIQHIEDSFDNVQSIDSDTSIFNTDDGVLDLHFDSGIKRYELVSSRIYYDDIPITPSNVIVDSFYLEPVYQGNSDIVGVRVNMQIVSPTDVNLNQEVNMLFSIR